MEVEACGVGLTLERARTGALGGSAPRVVGHELGGTVAEVGPGVTGWKPGDRVTASFYLTCGSCPMCAGGRETLCTAWRGYVGLHIDGGLAEAVVLPAANLVPCSRRRRPRRCGHRRRRHRHALSRLRRTSAAAPGPDRGGDRRRRGSGRPHGRHGPGLRRPRRGHRARPGQGEAARRLRLRGGVESRRRAGLGRRLDGFPRAGRSTSVSTPWEHRRRWPTAATIVGRGGTFVVVGFQPGASPDPRPDDADPRRGRRHRQPLRHPVRDRPHARPGGPAPGRSRHRRPLRARRHRRRLPGHAGQRGLRPHRRRHRTSREGEPVESRSP